MSPASPPPLHRHEMLALQQEMARLQGLLEASRQVHAAIEREAVLRCVLEIAVKELEADGAFFTPGPATADTCGVAYGRVPPQWLRGEEPQAWAGCPAVVLRDHDGQALTRLVVLRPGGPLSLEEQDYLEALALQSAVAVENARHHERMLAWERVQQDLAAARVIQRSLLPPAVPVIPGYAAAFRVTSCYEVGGDYLDVLPLPDGRVLLAVADVAGKGLASALVSASFRMACRGMASAGVPLPELAGRLSSLHHNEGIEARRRYVTAIFAALDPARHEIEVVNAGHNPGFLVGPDGTVGLLEASGPPLGMLPGMRYAAERHALDEGSRLLLYTDGLTEVFCGGEEFGTERLLTSFRALDGHDCEGVLESLWVILAAYTGSAGQADDMTALTLYRCRGRDRA